MKQKVTPFLVLFGFLWLAITNPLLAQNLSASATATASSGIASRAIDGDGGSRWESNFEDPQWIKIELDGVYTLNRLKIIWEGANARDYTIDISEDGTNWTNIVSKTFMAAGGRTDDLTVSGNAKYILLNGTIRNTPWGYSIWEFEVYGTPVGHTSTLTSINLTAPQTLIPVNTNLTITATGYDQDGYIMAITPAWTSTGGTITDGVFSSSAKGSYTVTATQGAISGQITITVGDPKITGTTALASTSNQPAANAVDGNMGTRWESASADPQWLYADLNSMKYLSNLKIYWEGANAKTYHIDISADAVNWQSIHTFTGGMVGARTDIIPITASARYIRMYGTERSAGWGYSIWEMELYGTTSATIALNNIELTAPTTTINAGQNLALSFSGVDQNGDPYAVNPTWSVNHANGSVTPAGVFSATTMGNYTVTLTDGARSKTIDITVLEPQVLTTITVTPANAVATMGQTLQFNAHGYDQNNNSMSITPTWQVTGGGSIDANGLFTPSTLGNFTVTATQGAISGQTSLQVKPSNIAVGKTASASSELQSANFAIDGNIGTRWETAGAAGDPQFITIDLGSTKSLKEFHLNWETASAKNYVLGISADNKNWQTLHTAVDMAPAPRIDNITVNGSARYVRMYGTARNTPYGYSLYEFEVLGIDLPGGTVLAAMDIVGSTHVINITESIQLEAQGFDAAGDAFAPVPVWTVDDAVNASVSDKGLFTSSVEGDYVVTATDGSISDTYHIRVKGPELTTIQITPVNSSVEAGNTLQYTATGYDQFGAVIAATFTYGVSGGGSINSSGLFSATIIGDYVVTISQGAISNTTNVTVLPGNIAKGATITASSEVQSASRAIDGNYTTAWECSAADSQCIYIDFAQIKWVTKAKLFWAANAARSYTLAISADAISWQTVYSKTNYPAAASTDEAMLNASTRYLRLLVRQRNGAGGALLNEFEVYGNDLPIGKTLTSITLSAPKTTIKVGDPIQIEAVGADADGNPFATAPAWSVTPEGATISNSGLLVPHQMYAYVITATQGSFTPQITITAETNARLARVDVNPATVTVNIGQSKTFTAQGFDQFLDPFAATYDWTTNGGGSIDASGIYTATTLGTFMVTATSNSVSPTTLNISGNAQVTVIRENLALNKQVQASSETQVATNVNDNNPATYWQSTAADTQSVVINLGTRYYLSKLNLDWKASAKKYQVSISADQLNWTNLVERTNLNGNQRLDEIPFIASAQYVKLTAYEKNVPDGYQLNEFQILGEAMPVSKSLASIALTAAKTSLFANEQLQINIAGTDNDNEPYAVTPVWSVNNSGTVSPTGIFTPAGVGMYTITATQGSISSEIQLSVLAVPHLNSLVIESAITNLFVNDQVQLTAKGFDQYNAAFATAPVWSVTGPANINQSGLLVATGVGSVTVTITDGSVTANKVFTILPENLVLNKAVTASSAAQPAANAVDGLINTRWESAASDPQWIIADMGAMHQITTSVINWEAASALKYTFDISCDQVNWQTIYTQNGNTAGGRIDSIKQVASGRYVRMLGTKRNTGYGYSIFELTVRGADLPSDVNLNSITIIAAQTTLNLGDSIKLLAYGYDQNQNPFAITPTWQVNNASAVMDQDGWLKPTAEGTYTVTAQSGSVSGTIDIAVRGEAVLTSISIDPATKTLRVSETAQFTATALNQYHETMDVDLDWTVNGGGSIDENGLFTASQTGEYTVTATSDEISATARLKVLKGNIALNKPIAATSAVTAARLANDGIATTRWESLAADPQSLCVDLQANRYIEQSIIQWEAASANDYQVQISSDSSFWQTIYSVTDNATGARTDTNSLFFTARYVKMTGTQRNTPYGYSIFEWQLIGENVPSTIALSSITVASEDTVMAIGDETQVSVQGFDQNGHPFAFVPQLSVNSTNAVITSKGVFSATAEGYYLVTATSGTVSKTIRIHVAGLPVLTKLTVSPAEVLTNVGQTTQFSTVALNQYNNPMQVEIIWSANNQGQISTNGLFTATKNGRFTVSATSGSLSSSANVVVLKENMALNKPVFAQSEVLPAINVNDGSLTTRWESQVADTQWIYINMGAPKRIDHTFINWEAASANDYQLLISADNKTWQLAYDMIDQIAGQRIDDLTDVYIGQYVKLFATQRNTLFGYSIFEWQMLGDPLADSIKVSSIILTADKSTIYSNETLKLNIAGYDAQNHPMAFVPAFTVDNPNGSVNDQGIFSADAAGEYIITVAAGTVAKSISVKVKAAPVLTQFTISPAQLTLHVGDSIQFAANGTDQYGNTMVSTCEWLTNGGGVISPNGLFKATDKGSFNVIATSNGLADTAEITIVAQNMALHHTIAASSSVKPATNANDGDMATYWESNLDIRHWIMIDFNLPISVESFIALWNNQLKPESYGLYISADAKNWQQIAHHTGNKANVDMKAGARFVKLLTDSASISSGYQLAEWEVLGAAMGDTVHLDSISLVAPTYEIATNQPLTLEAKGFDNYGNPLAFIPVWSTRQGATIDENGVFTASENGTYWAKVSSGNLNDSISIEVVSSILTSVEVSSAANTVMVGKQLQFNAQAFDQFHNTLEVDITWSVNGGGDISATGLFTATETGHFKATATSGDISGNAEFSVIANNQALNKITVASTQVNEAFLATDGSVSTFWESDNNESQWIYVDFANRTTFSNFRFIWDANSAKDFEVAISADTKNWQTIALKTDQPEGSRTDLIEMVASARYVRVKTSAKYATSGYQMAEFEAAGDMTGTEKTLSSVNIVALKSEIKVNEYLNLELQGFDSHGDPFAAAPLWTVNNGGLITADGKFMATTEGIYTIKADCQGITDEIVIVVKPSDVGSNAKNNLFIYYSQQNIVVKNLNVDKKTTIKLYNALGSELLTVVPVGQSVAISTSGLRSGLYIVKVISGNIVSKRIVIE